MSSARPTSPPAIHAQGLWKSYEEDGASFHALRGVDFSVAPGEYVAVMGPSGSGKTTLLQLVGSLDRPSRGEVSYAGRPSRELTDDELAALRARELGFVFQSFNLVPRMSALDNVMLPMGFLTDPAPRETRRSRAMTLLARVGLEGKGSSTPASLSGGQRQRVAIARALANDPAVILADEPTGNLDQATGRSVLALFDELHREGRSIVLVTHDEAVARRAQRVVHVVDGRVQSGASTAASPGSVG